MIGLCSLNVSLWVGCMIEILTFWTVVKSGCLLIITLTAFLYQHFQGTSVLGRYVATVLTIWVGCQVAEASKLSCRPLL